MALKAWVTQSFVQAASLRCIAFLDAQFIELLAESLANGAYELCVCVVKQLCAVCSGQDSIFNAVCTILRHVRRCVCLC